MTLIKVCCIQNLAEANLAILAGASALGLVSEMPSGPGVINENVLVEIARQTKDAISRFLLTSARDARTIIAQQQRSGVDTLQLVDSVSIEDLVQIKRALPGVQIVQVLHVRGLSSLDDAQRMESFVDAVLLDSGNPGAAVRELGGTGRTHDWDVSRRIVEALTCPVWLAGGLNPANVASAIQNVHPYGVDLCNGIRREGRLIPTLLQAFVRAVQQADGQSDQTSGHLH